MQKSCCLQNELISHRFVKDDISFPLHHPGLLLQGDTGSISAGEDQHSSAGIIRTVLNYTGSVSGSATLLLGVRFEKIYQTWRWSSVLHLVPPLLWNVFPTVLT